MAYAAETEILKVKAGDNLELVATSLYPGQWERPEDMQWNACAEGRGLCDPHGPEVSF